MTEKVIVIGAGVYGAAVAFELSKRGAQVTVVDAGQPGAGTSNATFAWTNANGSKEPREYHDLNVASMEAHRKLAQEAGRSDWYQESGNLQWGGDDAERAELRRKVETGLKYGYPTQWLTRDEVARLEPDINPSELPEDEIAYFPTEGWVSPTRLIGYLLAQSGAEKIWDDAVVGFDISDDRVRSVRLASGRQLQADAVVNCAGPQAAQIAQLAGLALPMSNTHGVLVHTSPVAISASSIVMAPNVHIRQDGGGRLQLHSYQHDGAVNISSAGETTVEPAAVDKIVEAASALYPAIREASIESVRVGERPIPGDGLPVLGRAVKLPNFHFAVSHSGVTLSVYAGGLVAAEVLGEDHSAELAPFRVERFS